MRKIIFTLLISAMFFMSQSASAGNPDRQGEAGGYELLMNPWARSAGIHSMNTSSVMGVDAMRLNPAGIARSRKTTIQVAHTRYLTTTGIKLNAGGVAIPIGESGSIGISVNSVSFGDIPLTTEANPEPNELNTFSPTFFNLGLGYGHVFDNKVSVGVLVRVVSESINNASAFAFAIDAGVQYTAGEKDNFKLGISLRNVGSDIVYSGQGLSLKLEREDVTLSKRPLSSPLPSVLNIGTSYDFYFGAKNRLTAGINFTANSFARDLVGGFLEYGFDEMFFLRGGYKAKLGDVATTGGEDLYTGLAVGAGMQVNVSKYSDTQFLLDYSYRPTNALGGTHNFGIGFTF